MKKKIAGWILLVWGSLGLLLNLIFWLPSLTELDMGVFIINSCACVVFMVVGVALVKKGKKNIVSQERAEHYG